MKHRETKARARSGAVEYLAAGATLWTSSAAVPDDPHLAFLREAANAPPAIVRDVVAALSAEPPSSGPWMSERRPAC